MIKKSIVLVTAMICSALVFSSAMAASSIRVGVVDMRTVLQKSSQVAEINETLKKQFKERDKELTAKRNTLKSDMEKLKKNGSVMKRADKDKLEKKIKTEEKNLTQMQVKVQQDLMAEQSKYMRDLVEQVKLVMKKIAKSDRLNVILDKAAVVYSDEKMDVTDEVMVALKKSGSVVKS